MSIISSAPFSPEEIAAEGLTPAEYEEIVKRLGRHPNKAELGMFGVMWSEHCCYKNSRPLLKQFPTTGERILIGPGENAGVVDLGNKLQLAFKIESHNHPSAIEPFQGAATGVGGILRDIFTMGARPIAILNSLRFGSLNDARTRRIFTGVVDGIAHYGNCLIASETLIWRDEKNIHFDTIGNFVESHLPPGATTAELPASTSIQTLSLNLDNLQSCWQPVRRIFKRHATTLITIHTTLGRTLTITPDHPTLILENGEWRIRQGHALQIGDIIPLLIKIPTLEFQQLAPTHNSDIYIKLPSSSQPIKTNIRYPKAIIEPDESFARLLGYYLSKGYLFPENNTYKIIFTFPAHNSEYVDDVVEGLKNLGLQPNIEKHDSSLTVYTTSWLLGYLLKEIWKCGSTASEKAFPDFVFQWHPYLQREALKSLLQQNEPDKITFATTSSKLFQQTVILLQTQGAIPIISQKHLQQHTLWQLEICPTYKLTTITNTLGEKTNDEYSLPENILSDELAFVKIKNLEIKNVEECNVYDIEVDNTHLFATTSGIVTHNCVGVPTVGGEVYFDPAYSGNPLVNVMALGLMETPEIVKSAAAGIGNPVLYVGSTTGRDGMGGASFASAELTDKSIDERPAVQVGDPFLEKSLIEACLEAFKTGAVVAAQDMGAAGITCSTSEMAAKGGVGIELDLDKIPTRESGMVPYEYLLSESQERMLFVAQKGREQELIDIFHRWGLHAVVAGTVISEPVVRILFKGEIAAEIPAKALAENTPIYYREILTEPPEYAVKAWQWKVEQLLPCDLNGIKINGSHKTWNEILLTLLDTPSLASKQWVFRQYDHQVQNNTVVLPGSADAAVIRLRPVDSAVNNNEFKSGVAATVDCNSRYVYLDPFEGAKAVVAEAARNLSCVGAEPLAVTDNLNFGNPEKAICYWQLALACRGIASACREFNTPVTGGNVSLYNETLDSTGQPTPIYPTPVVGMVGLIPDLNYVCRQGWQNPEDEIYLLGLQFPDAVRLTLGGSEYLATIHGTVAGKPPIVDFELERQVQAACRQGIRQGWVRSAHDCAEGGLACALAESCISSNLGAEIQLPAKEGIRPDELLFAEGGARIVVSVLPEKVAAWEAYLRQHLGTENWSKIGKVGVEDGFLRVFTVARQPLIEVRIADMRFCWQTAIERRLSV